MRKRVILALMLAVAMLVTSGCKLIVKDAEVDRLTPIIEVGGKVFNKGEITDQVNNTLDYQEYIYSMYGYGFDKTDPSVVAEAQTNVIDGLIRQTVIEQKIADMGMAELTSEELAEVQASVDETYTGYVDSVKSDYFAETELTGEELDKAVEEEMADLGYPTKDALLESEKETKAQDKLKAEVVKDAQVTEEEVQARYDEKVAEEKTSYESNLSAYGSAVSAGDTVYYAPAGYRYVKHILRQISEDDDSAIQGAQNKLTDAQAKVTELETSLAGLPENPAEDAEEEAANRAQWEQDKLAAEADVTSAQTELDAVKETAYANLQPMVDEILQKIAEGADFDALIEEYGEDDGMKASPAKEQGYPVCEGDTQWVPEFTAGAMALEKVGDVSPAVRTNYGIHILKYVGDVQEGPVALESVKDELADTLLTEKQDALYETTVSQWIEEAGAKVYRDALE